MLICKTLLHVAHFVKIRKAENKEANYEEKPDHKQWAQVMKEDKRLTLLQLLILWWICAFNFSSGK